MLLVVLFTSGCGGCTDDVDRDGKFNVEEHLDAGELDTRDVDSGDDAGDASDANVGDTSDDVTTDVEHDVDAGEEVVDAAEECAEFGEPCEHDSDCCEDAPTCDVFPDGGTCVIYY